MAAISESHTRIGRIWRNVSTTTRGATEELFPHRGKLARHNARQDGWQLDGPDDYCNRCGVTAPFESRTERGCAFCIDNPIPWDRIVRLGSYTDPMADWVRSMKFNNQWHWTEWFGQTLGEMVGEIGKSERTAVCCVPMHWRRRYKRGYNQSQMVADCLASELNLDVMPLLKRAHNTKPQWSRPMSLREENVQGSIVLTGRVELSGWHIILVDDVKTSGATLGLCSRILKKAGAASVTAAVIAVANHHRDSGERVGGRA